MSLSAKRARHEDIAPPSAGSSADDRSPWTSLHADMVRLIGWRVLAGDLPDYVRFRAVCVHWRSSTVCPRGQGIADPRFHPRRWRISQEGHGLGPDDDRKRFFNLSTGASVCLRLPLLADHVILQSVEGLLLVRRKGPGRGDVRLLNPFTGDAAVAELSPFIPYGTSYPFTLWTEDGRTSTTWYYQLGHAYKTPKQCMDSAPH
ncbi:hypothetical protein ACQ4PT_029273 [Festuca glaucescens]